MERVNHEAIKHGASARSAAQQKQMYLRVTNLPVIKTTE